MKSKSEVGKESVKKIKAHWAQRILMEQSSMSTAISREPLLWWITPHPVSKQQVVPSNWTVHRSALPISNALSVRYLLVLLLLSYWSAPHWALPDDNCQWGTTGQVIQSRDSGALVIWLLPLCTLHFLFIYFFNRECICGRWGNLSFPTQYESWSVPHNISGGDIYDFLGSDV